MMKLHANVLRFSYFFYRIIDRITEFSFIIFSDFIHFMKCFILSTIDYHLFFFLPLPIIYCILLFICQSLTINLCDTRVNNLFLYKKQVGSKSNTSLNSAAAKAGCVRRPSPETVTT